MHRLWFVVPAHGRVSLSRVCLRQLRRTCDALGEMHIEASAVVIADDENLETARSLGFATIERDNRFLSRKFNDGIQLACDPEYNPRPAHFVVPCGSDDWVDPQIFRMLPSANSVVCFRYAAFVDETGETIVAREVDYDGGVGIRVYTAKTMAKLDYRPADEDRDRGCDTSIYINLRRASRPQDGPTVVYRDVHGYQVVDWKSRDAQLNPYSDIVARFRRGTAAEDPFVALQGIYPEEALAEMAAHYGRC